MISIDAIQTFYEKSGTPDNKKRIYAFQNVDTHVVPSKYQSKDLPEVRKKTIEFMEEVLFLKPQVVLNQ